MFLSKLKMLEYQFKVFRTLFISDEEYRRKKFKKIFGKEVSLISPKTLNEKLITEWLISEVISLR